MSTAAALIRGIDFFQPLDDRLIEKIARLCIPREYSPGDYIVRQGDPGLGLYFITRGTARVEITRDGVTSVLAELHPGEVVGELSIIDLKPRSANVVCVADTSCLLLTRDSFMKLVDKHPEIALQMARTLAGRLRNTDERISQRRAIEPQPWSQFAPVEKTYKSDRQKVKDMLTDAVSWVYLLNSVTQFSLAIVGCPVTVNLETKASASFIRTIGQVKLVLFPAGENHVIGVHPFADGDVTVTTLQPVITAGVTGVSVSRASAPVRKNQSLSLRVPLSVENILFARPLSAERGMRHLASAFDF